MEETEQTINTISRMVVAISEKRRDFQAHLCQDEYKLRPQGPIYNKHDGEKPKSPKQNPRI